MSTKRVQRLLAVFDSIAETGKRGITRQRLYERFYVDEGQSGWRKLERDIKELRATRAVRRTSNTEVETEARVAYFVHNPHAARHLLMGERTSPTTFFEADGGLIEGELLGHGKMRLLVFPDWSSSDAIRTAREKKPSSRFLYLGEYSHGHYLLEAPKNVGKGLVYIGRHSRHDKSAFQRAFAGSPHVVVGLGCSVGLAPLTASDNTGHLRIELCVSGKVLVTDLSPAAADCLVGLEKWTAESGHFTRRRFKRDPVQSWDCVDTITQFSAGSSTLAVVLPEPIKT